MKTLIIGAGIAGLTLAALLRQRGEGATVVERNATLTGQGYMLGLFPLGGRVLHGLRLHDAYLQHSLTMNAYHIGDDKGRIIRRYRLDDINRHFGSIQGIERDALIDLLLERVDQTAIRTSTTIATLRQHDEAVTIEFNDGSHDTFDLVVAADGLHSDTRKRLLKSNQYQYHDTGWGGWVFWSKADTTVPSTYTEYWGQGRFLGLYPTGGRVGVFAGGNARKIRPLGLGGLLDDLKGRFNTQLPALEHPPRQADDAFYWPFHDCRCRQWRKGRVILLGDAAVGFLPTAGIGASMAMESAAALNDELSRADAGRVKQALSLYEKRHRRRVEKAQTSSRKMGKMMFVTSPYMAWVRDRLLQLYSVENLARDIARIMDEPI